MQFHFIFFLSLEHLLLTMDSKKELLRLSQVLLACLYTVLYSTLTFIVDATAKNCILSYRDIYLLH